MKKRVYAWCLALLAGLYLGAAPGCSQNQPSADAGPAPLVVHLEPVPAPDELGAQIFIPAPQEAWKKIRAMMGGPALLLPSTPSGLIGTLIGLPVAALGEIDENLTIFGAVALSPEGAKEKPLTLSNSKVVMGVHLRSGGRFIDMLTKGESPRFSAAVDASKAIARLTPKSGDGGGISIGVIGNYLIISNNTEALNSLGPYVARTMPKGEVPKEDIAVHLMDKSLSELLVPMLGERILSQNSALGELGASIFLPTQAVGRFKEIAPDLKNARIALKLDENRARIQLRAQPKTQDGPAAAALSQMTVGDLSALIEMPADTIIGILDRDTSESRAASVTSYSDMMIRALGGPEKVAQADRESITAAWKAVSAAQGDFRAMGLAFGPTGPVGYARMPAPDEQKLSKALRQFTDVSKRKAIKDALSSFNLKVTSKKTVIENIEGDAERLRFERIPPEKGGPDKASKKAKESKAGADEDSAAKAPGIPEGLPLTIDLYWIIRGGTLYAAAGYEPKLGLVSVMESARKNNWGGIPEIRNTIESLGNEISFALLVDPLRFVASRAGKPGAAPPAPIVLAIGKESKESLSYSMELYMSAAAVQELIKHRDALMPKD